MKIQDKYTIKATSHCIKKGCWNVNDVDIFMHHETPIQLTQNILTKVRNWKRKLLQQKPIELLTTETKIGSYRRNYSSMLRTWCPFTQDGKDYALYSDHYVATSVMSLPDCKNVVTEPLHSNGFCPADFYVPEGVNGQFGFVAGCVWGDDSSWKIEFLDLSKISEGIIKREYKFGYIELPSGRDLCDVISIDIYHWPKRRLADITFCVPELYFWKDVKDDEFADLIHPKYPEQEENIEYRCQVTITKKFDLDKDYSEVDHAENFENAWMEFSSLIQENS